MAKRVLPGIGSGLPWSLGDVLASKVAHAVAQVTKGILAPPGDTWRSNGSGLDALISAELAKAVTGPAPYVDPETHRLASDRVKEETRDAGGRWTSGGAGGPAGWTCTHLSDSHGFGSGRGRRLGGFEGDGAEVAKAPVPTVRVVPRFDIVEDGLDHVGP